MEASSPPVPARISRQGPSSQCLVERPKKTHLGRDQPGGTPVGRNAAGHGFFFQAPTAGQNMDRPIRTGIFGIARWPFGKRP